MRLPDETYESIKSLVADVLVEYKMQRLPIDVIDLAKKMGLSVSPYSSVDKKALTGLLSLSSDGILVPLKNDKGIIYYNDFNSNRGRIRHTIGHEIGHFVLGHKTEGEEEEAEAGFFSKYLLAPIPIVHVLLKNKDIESIVNTFAISYEAASNVARNYQTWLQTSNEYYTSYEEKILDLFNL